jgi:CheY-like chemotaxis protein
VTAPEGMCRIVLRAQVRGEGDDRAPIVTNTVALSESGVHVVAELPCAVGAKVHVQLSFPGLLEPQTYTARVEEIYEPNGPGLPRTLAMTFLFDGADERQHIYDLLARVRESGVFRTAPVEGRKASYRVLIVEDNSMIRDMFAYGVEKYFRKHSTAVVVDFADDAESAWEMLVRSSYELAIIDYFLPHSNGAALVARMRRDPKLQSVPVVAISVGGVDAREASLGAGADLFLDKPIVLRDLFSTLARLTLEGGQ